MKTIHLIRHAKSCWNNPSLNDHQRPLSQRGLNDAAIMSAELFKTKFKWPQIYCSSARRAQLTIKALVDHWPKQAINWQLDDRLYTFSSTDIWHFVHDLNDELDAVVLIGHNPALTDFINSANETQLDNLATCAYAKLTFSTPNWHHIEAATGTLASLLKPKMLR